MVAEHAKIQTLSRKFSSFSREIYQVLEAPLESKLMLQFSGQIGTISSIWLEGKRLKWNPTNGIVICCIWSKKNLLLTFVELSRSTNISGYCAFSDYLASQVLLLYCIVSSSKSLTCLAGSLISTVHSQRSRPKKAISSSSSFELLLVFVPSGSSQRWLSFSGH